MWFHAAQYSLIQSWSQERSSMLKYKNKPTPSSLNVHCGLALSFCLPCHNNYNQNQGKTPIPGKLKSKSKRKTAKFVPPPICSDESSNSGDLKHKQYITTQSEGVLCVKFNSKAFTDTDTDLFRRYPSPPPPSQATIRFAPRNYRTHDMA